MSDDILRTEVRLNAQGRVVIPAEIRRALGWDPGEELIMYVEDGALVMDTRANILRRVQDEFAKVPPERDMVQELLDRRKREQKRADERLQPSR